MAKYFVGKKEGSNYQPLNISDIETSILSAINFTTSFIDEIDFKEYLLKNNYIQFYDEDIFYIKEEGTKNERKYRPINLGKHIAFGIEKKYFNVDDLYDYLIAHKYDIKFIDRLTYHYIEKYDVASHIQAKIIALFEKQVNLEDFFSALNKITDEFTEEKERIMRLFSENDYFAVKRELEELSTILVTRSDIIVPLYHYFKNKINIPYGITLNYLSQLYVLATKANQIGIEQAEKNENDCTSINRTVEFLLISIVYKYDAVAKAYKRENNEYILYERNLADLGLFIMLYERMTAEKIKQEDYIYEEDHEEFLEEEDFKRMHTTSEREGIKLVYKDYQKNS